MMLPSRLGCPLSLKTPNMGNTGLEVSKAFTGLVESCVNRIVSAIHESHTLAAQRDALLPGLVSGEVGVGDTEEFGIKRD